MRTIFLVQNYRNLLKSVLVRFDGDGFFVEERKRLVNSLISHKVISHK